MNTCQSTSPLPGVVTHKIPAVVKDVGRHPGSVGNVKVSPGIGNDSHPRMTTNAADDIIIVYEQEEDITNTTIPVVYSADGGDIWTQQFIFNSSLDYYGSGILSDPDIIYNPEHDVLWCNAIDPHIQGNSDKKVFYLPGISHMRLKQ